MGSQNDAIEAYDQAIDHFNNNAINYFKKGLILSEKRKYDKEAL